MATICCGLVLPRYVKAPLVMICCGMLLPGYAKEPPIIICCGLVLGFYTYIGCGLAMLRSSFRKLIEIVSMMLRIPFIGKRIDLKH